MFKGKIGILSRAMGGVPVRRRTDQESEGNKGKVENDELEKESRRAMDEGRLMCVFPEGTR